MRPVRSFVVGDIVTAPASWFSIPPDIRERQKGNRRVESGRGGHRLPLKSCDRRLLLSEQGIRDEQSKQSAGCLEGSPTVAERVLVLPNVRSLFPPWSEKPQVRFSPFDQDGYWSTVSGPVERSSLERFGKHCANLEDGIVA